MDTLDAIKKKEIKKLFLEALADDKVLGNVSDACKQLIVARQTMYNYRQQDADFAKEWDKVVTDIHEQLADLAETKLIELVVCDGNANLKLAARKHFPAVKIQTCFNHLKENIRRSLRVRSDETYREFMKRVEVVLPIKLSDEVMAKQLFALYRDYREDVVAISVLTNVQRHWAELAGYRGIPHSPVTTNIIEGLNAHLEARLVSLRSFQSPKYAHLWLNGYVLKRRFTKFTCCRGKFKSLNGKRGVETTLKPRLDFPTLF
jgi:hypothetical protein